MSHPDASAAYRKVTLLVASAEQFRHVLTPLPTAPTTTLLDVGAGRGAATVALASVLGGLRTCGSNLVESDTPLMPRSGSCSVS